MDPNIAIEADILAVGYQLRYFSESDIERWADSHIAEEDTPSDALLGLSILRNVYPVDVLNRIKAVGTRQPSLNAELHLGIVGLLFEQHKVGLEATIRSLYSLIHDESVELSPAMTRVIYDLDDNYDTAVGGFYGSLSDVELATERFVSPYADKLRNDHSRLIRLPDANQ